MLNNAIKNNSRLVKNFSSLTVLQLSNYIFPLITFPYLVRVMGPENYGLVAFANAFIAYFIVITDYGFNLSGTQAISLSRSDNVKTNATFSTILILKFLFLVICFIPFIFIISYIPIFKSNFNIYFYSFLSVVGSVLFPLWLFQGLEKMGFIAAINIGVRVFTTISIFLFITYSDDVLLLVIINGISSISIGLISLVIVFTRFKIRFVIPTVDNLIEQLKEGWYLFLSTVSISLYTTSNVFILGLFATKEIVGYFSAADKIRMAMQGLFSNAGQTIFPHLSSLFQKSYEEAISFIKKYLKWGIIIITIFTITVFIGSDLAIKIILGENFERSILILRFLIFLPAIIFLSNVFGIQIMLNLGYKKEFSRIISFGALINVSLAFILVPLFYEIGTAISVLLTEFLITFSMYYFLRSKKVI